MRYSNHRWVRQLTAGAIALGSIQIHVARAADETSPPTTAARATTEASAAQLTEEGLLLYKARDYRRAAEKFLQAYASEPDPNLWFNVARCYQALGDSSAAIEKYEGYLRSPNIEASGRERAEKALKALREGTETRQAAQSRTPEKPAAAEKSVMSSTERGASPPPADRSSVETSSNGDATRIGIGWAVTAVLAAGTVVSGVLAIDSAHQLAAERQVFPGNGAKIDVLTSRTTTLGVTADVLGVATAAGAALSLYWTFARPSGRGELKAAVGMSGVKLVGSF